ncbi:hypothetical protein LTR70_005640 [Exophiala xenobiotica]|uniref:DJ-1/PfpI domain-containing protein n=1 Tax=Lithohypha guttulata TaxID=1690604 RepID=A0ABR0JYS8_9EURO|nr:hypothetical protein LTR24_008843 [Lithohypha guttulata]KAK5317960.1 hypothetical protein LTR70_005640 [Exophiala xenobiotica]
MAPREISIGFLLIPLQALDMVGPMDILANITHDMVSFISPDRAEQLSAPKITFHHIGPTMDPVQATGNLHIKPTTTIAECPKLDYLLVGGPMPDYAHNVPAEMKAFMRERSEGVKTIFTTCTGGLVLAATGLLDGLEATTNHTLIRPHGEQIGPRVKWDERKNWVVAGGGKFWTAAGAGAGMDMMAEWVRQEFSQELLDFSTMGLEWQPRDVDGKGVRYMNGRMEIVEA